MKDLLTNANFPRSSDLRVYHLGIRPGEVANRIVTVGSPSRAETVAALLDDKPTPHIVSSERGFLTITGRYRRVPVSVVSIGMGSPNMDFFVREIRESVTGDMVVIRLGSCGALTDIPVSSVVVPERSVQISRNVDFDFSTPESNHERAYRISKPASADLELADQLIRELAAAKPMLAKSQIIQGKTNASADSFYSSQGRQTSFDDHNGDLLDLLQNSVPHLATLEMETFHLYHLANCWNHRSAPLVDSSSENRKGNLNSSVIRAAAAHLVFASRSSQDFITPQEVEALEKWTSQAVLNALVKTEIAKDRLHEDSGSVWGR